MYIVHYNCWLALFFLGNFDIENCDTQSRIQWNVNFHFSSFLLQFLTLSFWFSINIIYRTAKLELLKTGKDTASPLHRLKLCRIDYAVSFAVYSFYLHFCCMIDSYNFRTKFRWFKNFTHCQIHVGINY